MQSGLVARITGMDRRIGLAVVVLVLVLLVGMPVYLMSGGGENGDGNAAGDAPFVPVQAAPLVLGSLPPLFSQEEMVAQSVAATIEAIPTPTPTPEPTPNVAATLQAQLTFNREKDPPVIMLNPLDSEGVGTPISLRWSWNSSVSWAPVSGFIPRSGFMCGGSSRWRSPSGIPVSLGRIWSGRRRFLPRRRAGLVTPA